ncbi:MAG TPA: hypothetical protein VJ111_14765 [Chitinophagaceae bacterium]|nr:hypothetical protein [Chitinophagaceae bacterium]
MSNLINCRMFFPMLLLFCLTAQSQNADDTEFRKGWATYLKLDNGVISNFHSSPDLYVGGLQVNPQITVVEHKLRIGATAGFVYANKKIAGLFGPSFAFKLKSFNLKNLAGLANLQLIAEHNWGTEKQQLVGGGIGLELLQKAMLIFTAHRDYNLNTWWIQAHVGIRLKKNKNKVPEFNQ